MSHKFSIWALCVIFVVSIFTGLSACGPSLDGKIELVETIKETPATAICRNGNFLYVVDENGKMQTYDLQKPENPVYKTQVDAFTGPHIGLRVFGSSRMLLMGQDGRIALFDISIPSTPSPVWGQGKTLRLPKVGPFLIRSDLSVIYMTPGNGTALMRVELGNLNKPGVTQTDLDQSISEIKGGGGGGLALARDETENPVRLYIGNRDSGKLDIWEVGSIETKAATAPSASSDIKAGKDIREVFFFKEKADSIQGWLILISDSNAIEYLDLGKRWRYASDPKSIETFELKDLYLIDIQQKVMVSKDLDIYTYTASDIQLSSPQIFAKPELRAKLDIRDLLVYNNLIYTAEIAGFRVYRFGKREAS